MQSLFRLFFFMWTQISIWLIRWTNRFPRHSKRAGHHLHARAETPLGMRLNCLRWWRESRKTKWCPFLPHPPPLLCFPTRRPPANVCVASRDHGEAGRAEESAESRNAIISARRRQPAPMPLPRVNGDRGEAALKSPRGGGNKSGSSRAPIAPLPTINAGLCAR